MVENNFLHEDNVAEDVLPDGGGFLAERLIPDGACLVEQTELDFPANGKGRDEAHRVVNGGEDAHDDTDSECGFVNEVNIFRCDVILCTQLAFPVREVDGRLELDEVWPRVPSVANKCGPKLLDGRLVGFPAAHYDLDGHADEVVELDDSPVVFELAVLLGDVADQLVDELLTASGHRIIHIRALLESLRGVGADVGALLPRVVLGQLQGQPGRTVPKVDATEREDGSLGGQDTPAPHKMACWW